jgi:ribonuclease T1
MSIRDKALRALIALLLALIVVPVAARGNNNVTLVNLPPEAQQTLRLIEGGGPFPYRRDGVVFGNFERRLPIRQRGYYHEYTVPTPVARTRGARRIIAGDTSHGEYYYTEDHYRTFWRIRE